MITSLGENTVPSLEKIAQHLRLLDDGSLHFGCIFEDTRLLFLGLQQQFRLFRVQLGKFSPRLVSQFKGLADGLGSLSHHVGDDRKTELGEDEEHHAEDDDHPEQKA